MGPQVNMNPQVVLDLLDHMVKIQKMQITESLNDMQ